ncbi:TCDD-inducible poly [ADP-ribose] polymerase-like [Pelobates cultripes]|uniref:TCDD-inducible poly [ADP-ribose] polymerase-like n=2 Tax=Pelobates cultripes TaxID=61616 RepID=A0AAD1RJU3_PELCU|nr:TCDD-inducible poly [ADP-ribose] polymerase-like [Pelobates cultripes]
MYLRAQLPSRRTVLSVTRKRKYSSYLTVQEPTEEENYLKKLEFTEVHKTKDGTVTDVPLTSWGEQENLMYHIHQGDGIDICSDFLAGNCDKGAKCLQHHTILPFAWQLQERSTGTWHTVGGWGQEILERLYCDPNIKRVCSKSEGQPPMNICFNTMDVKSKGPFYRIRRLSTSLCPTMPFNTRVKYYYGNHCRWTEYSQEISKCIEECLTKGHKQVMCSSPVFRYLLDLQEFSDTNIDTGTKRTIRIRPVFRSPCMMSELWMMPSVCPVSSSCSLDHVGSCRNPRIWFVNDPFYEKVSLSFKDMEFVRVYNYFHKTMSESQYMILDICRIQNYFQMEKYARKKDYMSRILSETENNNLERYLFYSAHYALVENICRQNFDARVIGKHTPQYGEGCYFFKSARYAHNFIHASPCGHCFMFLAKVLVGCPTVGYPSLRRPPPLNPEDTASLLYDSCVSRLKDPNIFVLFDDDQFYPYFLIRYCKIRKANIWTETLYKPASS